MANRRFSTSSIKTGSKSNKMWDQDTQHGSMVPIASLDFNNSVTFSFGNIPQTYQDLMIVVSGQFNTASNLVIDDINLTSQTCSYTSLVGNGSTVISERLTNNGNALPVISSASQMFSGNHSLIIHILDYTSSSKYKTIISKRAADNAGSGTVTMLVGLAQITAALSYFKFSTQNGGAYFTGGSATLYGIKAGA